MKAMSADDLTDTSSADWGLVAVVVVVVASSTDSSTLVSSWFASIARRLHSSLDASRQSPSDGAVTHRDDVDDDASTATVSEAVWSDEQPEATDDCNEDSTVGRHCGPTERLLMLDLSVSKFIRLITNRRLLDVGDRALLGSVQLPLRWTPLDAAAVTAWTPACVVSRRLTSSATVTTTNWRFCRGGSGVRAATWSSEVVTVRSSGADDLTQPVPVSLSPRTFNSTFCAAGWTSTTICVCSAPGTSSIESRRWTSERVDVWSSHGWAALDAPSVSFRVFIFDVRPSELGASTWTSLAAGCCCCWWWWWWSQRW